MTKPKTDKSSSEILAEQEIQRLEENEAEITRLKKQMKPKTDNTRMGNPPTGTYFKEDKQGWEGKLGKLFEDRGFYSFYYLKEYGWINDFIRDLLSQQREDVRREVVEEIRDWVEQNRDERPDKLFNTDSKGGNYELGRRDENIVLINELVKILDKLALSSDGEKKGTKQKKDWNWIEKKLSQAHQQGYKEAVERIKLKLLGTDEEMERLWKNERGGLKEFVFNLRERQLRILAELEGKKEKEINKAYEIKCR